MKKRKMIERKKHKYSDIEIKLHNFVEDLIEYHLLIKGHRMELDLAKVLSFMNELCYQDEED